MRRYIDAEKLKRSIEAQCRVLRAIGIDELTEMTDVLSAGFIQEIENAPTVDVVEVVRCKDCIYHTGDDECTHGRWDIWSDNSDYGLYPEAMEMDYCSYGERKGERNVCSDRD